jgi:uncharacterized protein YecE (DUF72 family)
MILTENHYTGTSGYSYAYWKNRFYPEGWPAAKQLQYYATQFNTVELNHTFYRFPVIKSLAKAADAVPDDFRFSVKMNKVVTHTQRMHGVKDKVADFMALVQEGLGVKLACVLFQLPPSFSFTPERLDDILQNIPSEPGMVIEFRHLSWWDETVFKALRNAGITFCAVSFPGLPDLNVVTTDLFYKRMHGVPELFKSAYDARDLDPLANFVKKRNPGFVYFNNTMYKAGYTNALTLKEQLEG